MDFLERRAWMWLDVALLGFGLGLWIGAVESCIVAARVQLDLTWIEAVGLAAVTTGLGGAMGFGLGAAAGLLLTPFHRPHDSWTVPSRGLGAVTFLLAGWHLWPMAWTLHQTARDVAALAAATLPLAFAGPILYNARYLLHRASIVRPGTVRWPWYSVLGGLVITLGTATWMAWRPDQQEPSEVPKGAASVVVVTIDTLRRDWLGAYGGPVPTPHFDAFAKKNVLFLDAVTPLPETGPSHASLFTGLHPIRHGVLSNGQPLSRGFTTLAERLQEAGYDTGAFVSSFAVDSRTGLDQGFEVYDDDFFPWVPGLGEISAVNLAARLVMRFGDPLAIPWLLERDARVTNDRALRWLSRREGRPYFAWVHYFEPHAPYEAHEGSVDPPDVNHRALLADESRVTYTPEIQEALRTLYGEEVRYVDAELGRLLDGLDAMGLAETTLVIVTADHGEMLGEHGFMFNHHSIYDPAVRIPLAIRFPELLGGGVRVDTQVRMMDLPVTVMAWLRMDLPPLLEGIDLMPYVVGKGTGSEPVTLVGRKTASLSQGSLYGVRTGQGARDAGSRLKYILDLDTRTELLFDLEADPGEHTDISTHQPAVVQTCRTFVEQEAEAVEGRPVRVDASTLEGLRALGYVEDGP